MTPPERVCRNSGSTVAMTLPIICMGRILPCPAVLRLRREIGFPMIGEQPWGQSFAVRGRIGTVQPNVASILRPVTVLSGTPALL
jgi:hypothetical protein